MSHDDVEIGDMEWNEEIQAFTYPCLCRDLFQITKDDLKLGEEIAALAVPSTPRHLQSRGFHRRLNQAAEEESRASKATTYCRRLKTKSAQTGKASTSSDVFAYGVLLLEVVCGRGPIVDDLERGQVILVNWVIKQLQKGQILDVVDPNLGSGYVGSGYMVEEMELVLGLGLLCSNPKAEARPSMREILRYLNGDDLLPGIDQIGSSISSREVQETMSRFFELISVNTVSTSSHESSSIGLMSSSSLQAGR
ncbi:hypothetical protein Vadar_002959 [Vaccinium darrowii]|uniref:Uncharacterized protein n=1 Tax=Vaccinium darrowii TaxID=229202 RepID=A0ACB7ZH63_9ERIC|nr:hypothetical protein Vadar_002959 [Vaccinium darrowii]